MSTVPPVSPAFKGHPIDAVLRQALLAAARKQVAIGTTLFLVGLALLASGFPVVFIGAIIFGPVRAIKGLSLMARLSRIPAGAPLPADLLGGGNQHR
jgi:hypothetical protein